MNLAPLLWILSSFVISCFVYGSHMTNPYSIIDLTRAIYAVLLHSLGQCCRFLPRNPSVELVFYRCCLYVPSIWGLLLFVVLGKGLMVLVVLGRGLMVLVPGFSCLMYRSGGSFSACLDCNTFWHWNAFPSLMPISRCFLGRFVGWYGHFLC